MKKRISKFPLLLACIAGAFTACQTPTQRVATPVNYDESDYLISKNYEAADKLIDQLKNLQVSDGFIVASFTNINDLEESSSFGRISAEQVASRLAQHGLKILDIKLRKDEIYVQSALSSGGNAGEFLLSRNLKDQIGPQHDISAAVVGTYTTTRYGKYTHVNVRVLQVEDGSILAAHDFSLENREIQGLLRFASRN
jgi:hypothetical protein